MGKMGKNLKDLGYMEFFGAVLFWGRYGYL